MKVKVTKGQRSQDVMVVDGSTVEQALFAADSNPQGCSVQVNNRPSALTAAVRDGDVVELVPEGMEKTPQMIEVKVGKIPGQRMKSIVLHSDDFRHKVHKRVPKTVIFC